MYRVYFPFVSCVLTPSEPKPLAAPHPLKVAFFRKRRSFEVPERGGFRKGGRGQKDAQKTAQIFSTSRFFSAIGARYDGLGFLACRAPK